MVGLFIETSANRKNAIHLLIVQDQLIDNQDWVIDHNSRVDDHFDWVIDHSDPGNAR